MSTANIDAQMMQDLWHAKNDGRLHITSNRSVCKRADVTMPNRHTLKASAPGFTCVMTVGGTVLHLDGKLCFPNMLGGSIGGEGVWLQIEATTSDFWLDVRALVPTSRQIQERDLRSQPKGITHIKI